MLVNPIKSKALVISRTTTHSHIFPNLILDGIEMKKVTVFKVLGVVMD